MQTVVTALLTVIGSILGSGITAAWATARYQRKSDVRGKLEEAWLALHEYEVTMTLRSLRHEEAYLGSLTPQQLLDASLTAAKTEDKTAYRRLEMLVSIYLRSALPNFTDINDCRERLNAAISPADRLHRLGADVNPVLVANIRDACDQFAAAVKSLKDTIATAARSL